MEDEKMNIAKEQKAFEDRENAESNIKKSKNRLLRFPDSLKIGPAIKEELEMRVEAVLRDSWELYTKHVEWERSRDAIWKDKIEKGEKYLKWVALATVAIAVVEVLNFISKPFVFIIGLIQIGIMWASNHLL